MKRKYMVKCQMFKTKSQRVIMQKRKELKKLGAVILAIITITGGVLFIFRMNNGPTVAGKPAQAIEVNLDSKESEKRIFLENVESVKSGLYKTSMLVFGEEKLKIEETVGNSSKDVVTVEGNFMVKYSIDLRKMDIGYDFNTKEIVVKVPKDAIGVDSVELIDDIHETYRYKSLGNKLLDWIPMLNDDEELKETAIRQLLKNSKVQSKDYDAKELEELAEDELLYRLKSFNFDDVKYKVEFIQPKTIGINRTADKCHSESINDNQNK